MITLKDLETKFADVKFEDRNYDADSIKEVYKNNLPEGITPEIAEDVHKYDARFYQAYRSDVGNRIMNEIENDKDGELGTLEVRSVVSGLAFYGAYSRPVGDDISKKDCQSAFGFGYGMAKPQGEAKHLKDLGNRLYDALFAGESDEDDKPEAE